jgi:hypothetical protein
MIPPPWGSATHPPATGCWRSGTPCGRIPCAASAHPRASHQHDASYGAANGAARVDGSCHECSRRRGRPHCLHPSLPVEASDELLRGQLNSCPRSRRTGPRIQHDEVVNAPSAWTRGGCGTARGWPGRSGTGSERMCRASCGRGRCGPERQRQLLYSLGCPFHQRLVEPAAPPVAVGGQKSHPAFR